MKSTRVEVYVGSDRALLQSRALAGREASLPPKPYVVKVRAAGLGEQGLGRNSAFRGSDTDRADEGSFEELRESVSAVENLRG